MKKKDTPQTNGGQKETYDVFISYRREGGWATAKHLRDILVGKYYWVFFDMNSLKNGYFNNALFQYIDECQDFIIILSPNCLDRCKEREDDWVRKELAHALKTGKNIIPVMHEDFTFPSDLPDDIKDIAYVNGIRVYKEVFDAIVERIISFLKSQPHPPKTPKPWKKIFGILLVICALIAAGCFAFQDQLAGYWDKLFAGNLPPQATELPASPVPTGTPIPVLTDAPTPSPTNAPTAPPTEAPTAVPTEAPAADASLLATEKPAAVPTATPEVTNEHKWGSYEPKGTAVITMKDGTVYTAVANSLLLDSKKMIYSVGGNEYLYDGIDTPDVENKYELTNMKSFLEIVSINSEDGIFHVVDGENQELSYTLPDDAQFWFITEATTYMPEKIAAADVVSIVFDRTQTPNTDGLPYCTVNAKDGYFRTPAAFLFLNYNTSANYITVMRIAHEFTPFSNYPTKIRSLARLTVTKQGSDDPTFYATVPMEFEATLKSGEVLDFVMSGRFHIYAVSKYGRIRTLGNSTLLSIVFDSDASAAASETPALTASPQPAPTEKTAEARQGGSVLKADTLLGHSSLNAYDFPVFGSEIARRQVATVTFLDTLSGAPADAWDVSQNADGSVLAWAVPNESLYDLYIAGDGGVIAPESCKEMFCCYMYLHTISLNGAFHTENTTDMSYMFSSASHIKSMDLSQFNTQKVTNMSHMFYGCHSLEELDVSSFDTSSVINMDSMFFGAPLKKLDLHHFNTAKAVNMTYMFCGCDCLTVLDLSGFQMSRVYAASMFQGCDHLETVVLGKIEGLSSVKDMFANSLMMSDLYFNGTEEAWAACGIAAELPEDVQVHFFSGASAPAEIAEKASARQGPGVLMDDTLTDYALLDISSDYTVLGSEIKRREVGSITFVDRLSAATASAWDVSWDGDGSVLAWVGGSPWNYDLYIAADGGVTAPKYCRALFSGYRNVKTINFGNAFHTESVKDMSYMFANDTRLESLNLGRFSTANVISMGSMFYSCQSLKELDISSFDTSSVKTMGSMFRMDKSLAELDLHHFNTAKVKTTSYMFAGCESLKSVDVSAFDLSEVTSVLSMFKDCAQLETLTLGRFIGEKNQNISNLLSGCTALAHVYYDGTKEAWESSGLSAELPEGVQVHFAAGESAE